LTTTLKEDDKEVDHKREGRVDSSNPLVLKYVTEILKAYIYINNSVVLGRRLSTSLTNESTSQIKLINGRYLITRLHKNAYKVCKQAFRKCGKVKIFGNGSNK
jgi:hypothetical protein